MKFYEVGTYEQYEEGFHAFYRTQHKERAEQVKAWAEEYQAKTLEYPVGKSDEDQHQCLEMQMKLDEEFNQLLGKRFFISSYPKDEYSILIQEVALDD